MPTRSHTCPWASAKSELGPTYHSWLWCWVSAHALVPWRRAPPSPGCHHLCCPQCLCWSSGCGAWHLAPGELGRAPHLQGTQTGAQAQVSALLATKVLSVVGDRGWTTPWLTPRGLACRGCTAGESGPVCRGAVRCLHAQEAPWGSSMNSVGAAETRLPRQKHGGSSKPLSPRSQGVRPGDPSFVSHTGPRQEFHALVDTGSMEHPVPVTGLGSPRSPFLMLTWGA